MSSTLSTRTQALPPIPLEVLKNIGQRLDLKSAIELSLSCKSLRNGGEIRIWSSVDVSWLTSARHITDGDTKEDQETATTPSFCKSRIDHALAAFRAHPFRTQCVDTLLISPEVSFCKRLRKLLEQLHPGVRTLVVLDTFQQGDLEILQDFPHWPQLRNFRATTNARLSRTVVAQLATKMPNLSHLEIFDTADDGSTEFWPILPRLTHLSFAARGDRISEIPPILRSAPNLEYLCWMGCPEEEYPFEDLRKAFRGLRKLRTLILMKDPEYWRDKTVGGHTILDVGLTRLKVYGDISSSVHGEALELDLTKLDHIPRHPSLTHYVSPMGNNISRSEYAGLGIQFIPLEYRATRHVPDSLNLSLLCAPALVEISFEDQNSTGQVEPHFYRTRNDGPFTSDWIDWPLIPVSADEWENAGLRGLIIRTYISGTEDETLIHCRMLTRSRVTTSGEFYVGARRAWFEVTSFRGLRVPYPLLLQVYQVSDEDIEWQVGGRDLILSQMAWSLLNDWYDTLPASSQQITPVTTQSDGADDSAQGSSEEGWGDEESQTATDEGDDRGDVDEEGEDNENWMDEPLEGGMIHIRWHGDRRVITTSD